MKRLLKLLDALQMEKKDIYKELACVRKLLYFYFSRKKKDF